MHLTVLILEKKNKYFIEFLYIYIMQLGEEKKVQPTCGRSYIIEGEINITRQKKFGNRGLAKGLAVCVWKVRARGRPCVGASGWSAGERTGSVELPSNSRHFSGSGTGGGVTPALSHCLRVYV